MRVEGQQLATLPQFISSAVAWSILKLLALFAIFITELLVLTIFFDTGSISDQGALANLFRVWGADVLRACLTFTTVYVIFAAFSKTAPFKGLAESLANAPFSRTSAAIHAASMLVLFFSLNQLQQTPRVGNSEALLVGCAVAGALAVVFGFRSVVPLPILIGYLKSTFEFAFVPAAISGIVTLLFENVAKPVWNVGSAWTFNTVGLLLSLGRSDVVVDPANLTVGTKAFYVQIVAACSGLEGAALMLVFSGLWLWYFRAEHKFPRALLMIPAGVVAAWCFNAIRIAALILIGDAGAPKLAMGGFHSQAGWIAWNVVAFSFVLVLQRANWLRKYSREASLAAVENGENPTAWYIAPFLIILAASIVAHAATERPEMLYPVRLLAPIVVLVWFARHYRTLDWRLSWAAPLAGLAVAAMWLGFDSLAEAAPSTLQPQVALLPQPLAIGWIVARVIGATIIVPIAEELAFRGFLMRRLVSADFEAINPTTVGAIAIAISSVMFGLFHGGRLIEATLAGVLYALAYRQHGRFGDAVGAHAITNGVLAMMVLLRGDWHLW
jgi:exosortase E/protease (VPEID-CTERM system)